MTLKPTVLVIALLFGPEARAQEAKIIATPPASITGHNLMLSGSTLRDALNGEAILAGAEFSLLVLGRQSPSRRSPADDFDSALPTGKGPAATAVKTKASQLRVLVERWRGGFIYSETGAPIRVLGEGAIGSTVVVGPLASTVVFNTLRVSTNRERAAKITASDAIPRLRDVVSALRDGGEIITNVAVVIAYGSKNALDQSELARAEVLLMSAPATAVSALVNGTITEEELVEKSEFYLSDRESFALRKIKVVLQ
jgi:hypothetical protein